MEEDTGVNRRISVWLPSFRGDLNQTCNLLAFYLRNGRLLISFVAVFVFRRSTVGEVLTPQPKMFLNNPSALSPRSGHSSQEANGQVFLLGIDVGLPFPASCLYPECATGNLADHVSSGCARTRTTPIHCFMKVSFTHLTEHVLD